MNSALANTSQGVSNSILFPELIIFYWYIMCEIIQVTKKGF